MSANDRPRAGGSLGEINTGSSDPFSSSRTRGGALPEKPIQTRPSPASFPKQEDIFSGISISEALRGQSEAGGFAQKLLDPASFRDSSGFSDTQQSRRLSLISRVRSNLFAPGRRSTILTGRS
jgi:hypothetical protein